MINTHNVPRAATRVACALAFSFVLAACADGTAPRPIARMDSAAVALNVDASSAAWDAKLLPFLPDEGGVFGLRRSSEAMAISDL